MTRIRATCPTCGEVDVRPDDIRLEIVRDLAGEVGPQSSYRFECPECTVEITKPADERVARLLATGGVAMTVTRQEVGLEELAEFYDELPEHPEAPGGGPVFTPDDLIDFHALLAREDWFAALRAMV